MRKANRPVPVLSETLLKFAARLECALIPAPAASNVVTERLNLAVRDFGRVAAVLSTCTAALPPECPVGEPDVRSTLESLNGC